MKTDLITFDPPLKEKLFDNEDKVLITGVMSYNDTYLVIHESGFTDIRFVPEGVVKLIKEKLCATSNNI